MSMPQAPGRMPRGPGGPPRCPTVLLAGLAAMAGAWNAEVA